MTAEKCKHNFDPIGCGRCSEERKAAKERAERRQAIATVQLGGLVAGARLADGLSVDINTARTQAVGWARDAVILADALMEELDERAEAERTAK